MPHHEKLAVLAQADTQQLPRAFSVPTPLVSQSPPQDYCTAKSNPTQGVHDPDHAFGIPSAVFLKLFTNPPPFRLLHIAERHSQELVGGGGAFLNRQPFVPFTGQRR